MFCWARVVKNRGNIGRMGNSQSETSSQWISEPMNQRIRSARDELLELAWDVNSKVTYRAVHDILAKHEATHLIAVGALSKEVYKARSENWKKVLFYRKKNCSDLEVFHTHVDSKLAAVFTNLE